MEQASKEISGVASITEELTDSIQERAEKADENASSLQDINIAILNMEETSNKIINKNS